MMVPLLVRTAEKHENILECGELKMKQILYKTMFFTFLGYRAIDRFQVKAPHCLNCHTC